MIFDIHHYGVLPSTQQQLKALPTASEGCVVCADLQTHGRGQQGALWESEAGKNLLCSLLLTPRALPSSCLFDLLRAAALGTAFFLKKMNIDVQIKWANDIFAGSRKIAGILIEPVIRNDMVTHAIVGIGVNVNQREFAVPRAVSMASILGCTQDRAACLNALLTHIAHFYDLLQERQYPALRLAYHALLLRKTGMHRYRAGGKVFEAALVSVGNGGALTLRRADGRETQYGFKEVEFIFED